MSVIDFIDKKLLEKILALGAWALVAALALFTLTAVFWDRDVAQPVPFSHKAHVDFGMACVSCHIGADDAAKASIPEVQVCALCHVPDKRSPKTPPSLAEHIRDMKPIGWKKLYAIPKHVRFSHVLHTRYGGVECTSCHGDVPGRSVAMTRRLQRMDMGDCMNCHRKEKVTTDCLACHR